jgi:hypothetical protein
VQGNLASTYRMLDRNQQASWMYRDVYSGRLKLNGEEHERTLVAALNYAVTLHDLKRYAQVKALLRKTIPVAQRVLGDSDDTTLRLRKTYATALIPNGSRAACSAARTRSRRRSSALYGTREPC